jgi:hypothetical protein
MLQEAHPLTLRMELLSCPHQQARLEVARRVCHEAPALQYSDAHYLMPFIRGQLIQGAGKRVVQGCAGGMGFLCHQLR